MSTGFENRPQVAPRQENPSAEDARREAVNEGASAFLKRNRVMRDKSLDGIVEPEAVPEVPSSQAEPPMFETPHRRMVGSMMGVPLYEGPVHGVRDTQTEPVMLDNTSTVYAERSEPTNTEPIEEDPLEVFRRTTAALQLSHSVAPVVAEVPAQVTAQDVVPEQRQTGDSQPIIIEQPAVVTAPAVRDEYNGTYLRRPRLRKMDAAEEVSLSYSEPFMAAVETSDASTEDPLSQGNHVINTESLWSSPIPEAAPEWLLKLKPLSVVASSRIAPESVPVPMLGDDQSNEISTPVPVVADNNIHVSSPLHFVRSQSTGGERTPRKYRLEAFEEPSASLPVLPEIDDTSDPAIPVARVAIEDENRAVTHTTAPWQVVRASTPRPVPGGNVGQSSNGMAPVPTQPTAVSKELKKATDEYEDALEIVVELIATQQNGLHGGSYGKIEQWIDSQANRLGRPGEILYNLFYGRDVRAQDQRRDHLRVYQEALVEYVKESHKGDYTAQVGAILLQQQRFDDLVFQAKQEMARKQEASVTRSWLSRRAVMVAGGVALSLGIGVATTLLGNAVPAHEDTARVVELVSSAVLGAVGGYAVQRAVIAHEALTPEAKKRAKAVAGEARTKRGWDASVSDVQKAPSEEAVAILAEESAKIVDDTVKEYVNRNRRQVHVAEFVGAATMAGSTAAGLFGTELVVHIASQHSAVVSPHSAPHAQPTATAKPTATPSAKPTTTPTHTGTGREGGGTGHTGHGGGNTPNQPSQVAQTDNNLNEAPYDFAHGNWGLMDKAMQHFGYHLQMQPNGTQWIMHGNRALDPDQQAAFNAYVKLIAA